MADPLALWACPFCGGTRHTLDKTLRGGYEEGSDDPDAYAYAVRCLSCAAVGPWFKREGNARRMWNARWPREPQQEHE